MNDKLRRTKYGRALLAAAEDAYRNEIIDTEMEDISIGENGDYASKDEWIEMKLVEWLQEGTK